MPLSEKKPVLALDWQSASRKCSTDRSLIALTVVAVGHAVPTRDLAHQSVHTLSVKALADLNPAKTKDACKACVDGQSDLQTKEAAALAAADENAAMLTEVNTQEESAAKALKAEKAALVAYQAAQDDVRDT